MNRRFCSRFGVNFTVLAAVFLMGCVGSEDIQTPIFIAEAKVGKYPGIFQQDEFSRNMSDHARALAVALNDSAFRGKLYESIHYSRLPEHKLFWNAASSELRPQFASALSRSVQRVSEDDADLPDGAGQYELYLPVRAQRAVWKGGGQLLVAFQLFRNGPIIGYAPDGTWIELNSEIPPNETVLALVPTELRQADRLAPSEVNAQFARVTVAAALNWCEPEDPPEWCEEPPPPPPPTPPPTGLYVTVTDVMNKAEPWFRGDPEIEFVLMGTVTGRYFADPYFNLQPNLGFDAGEFIQPIACSGRLAPSEPGNLKRFDFNDDVHIYNQLVLLEQQSEFKIIEEPAGQAHTILWRRLASVHAPFYVQAWERDDGGECPTPAAPWLSSFRAGFGYRTYPTFRLLNVTAQGSQGDILSFLGITNENDSMGSWVFSTWDAFEALNGNSWFSGSHVNVRITNTGVNRYNVPTTIDPYWQ